ncbi:MAG: hypothetical protein NVS3B20_19370 [Polyangiales bacterium]
MLHEFVTANRIELIARTRAKVLTRSAPRPTDEELESGVPLFLDQLVEQLRLSTPRTELRRSSPSIAVDAAKHGGNLMRRGFTIAQVVHDYGDICQAVTELAVETRASITTDEFHTLNRCLDDAIAEAVTEYTRLRERLQSDEETERLGRFAHELRNKLTAGTLAFATLRSGRVGISGSTGALVERSLHALRDLINRSLTEVRIESGIQHRESVLVASLLEEVEVESAFSANAFGVSLTVAPGPPGLDVLADRAILEAAIANLLQNAFKFSRRHGHVSLTTKATADRVLFAIEDECGGLPQGKAEELFQSFTQRHANRKGIGPGLSISRRGIASIGGVIHVRDLPCKGCVFTIDVQRGNAS